MLAPLPGVVSADVFTPGQKVPEDDLLLVIEAMKMETGLYADHAGMVKAVHVQPTSQIDAKDLLVEIDGA
ncbi:MAG: hypothetical protein NXH97_16200 [Rhodobacteraceae bacterium]|nr:hypothetical protein [Paracoccaceae bacterium]